MIVIPAMVAEALEAKRESRTWKFLIWREKRCSLSLYLLFAPLFIIRAVSVSDTMPTMFVP